MVWISELGNFLSSLILSHWLPIMMTGVFSGLFELYERYKGAKIPYAKYVWWSLVVGLTASVFLTWQDEYRARIQAEKDIANQSGQIKILEKDKESLGKELAKNKNEYDQLRIRNESLTREADANSNRIDQLEGARREKAKRRSTRNELSKLQSEIEEFDKEMATYTMGIQGPIADKVTAWEKKVLDYIYRELGESDAATFRLAEGNRDIPPHVSSYGSDWRAWWIRLGAKKDAIEKLKDQLR